MCYRILLGLVAATLVLCAAACEPEPDAGSASAPTRTELLSPGALCITTQALPGTKLNASYSQVIRGAGGSGARYAWSISSGGVPGLALGAMGTPSTTLSGRPTAAGAFSLTIQLTDSVGATFSKAYTVCVLAFQLDSWEPCGLPGAPVDRGGSAVWTGKYLMEWGGFLYDSTSGSLTYRNEGTVYSAKFAVSRAMATANAPQTRWAQAAVACGDRMIVWGGTAASRGGLSNELNDGALYDPLTDNWTPTAMTGAPRARRDHSLAWTGSEMLVYGGLERDPFTGGYDALADLHAYNPVTQAWRYVSQSGPAPLSRARAFLHHDQATQRVIVFGGVQPSAWGTFEDRLNGGILDLSSGAWTSIPRVPDGTIAYNAAAEECAWTGNELLLYSALTGLWRYNPVSGAWRAASPASAPALRLPTVTWAGAYAVVYGQNGDLAEGHIYNVGADLWSPMNMAGATFPIMSVAQRRFWAGTHLIVWGGVYYSQGSGGFVIQSSEGGLFRP